MKNPTKTLWLKVLLLVLTIGLASCKKDEVKTGSDYLTGGSSKAWKISSAKSNGVSQTLDADDLAERMTFNSTGTWIQSGNSNTSNGEWRLTNNDKTLGIRFKDESTGEFDSWNDWELKELSDAKLTIYYVDTDGGSKESTWVPAN